MAVRCGGVLWLGRTVHFVRHAGAGSNSNGMAVYVYPALHHMGLHYVQEHSVNHLPGNRPDVHCQAGKLGLGLPARSGSLWSAYSLRSTHFANHQLRSAKKSITLATVFSSLRL